MEGYCPYCDALLEVGAYQETVTAKEGEAIFLMNFNATFNCCAVENVDWRDIVPDTNAEIANLLDQPENQKRDRLGYGINAHMNPNSPPSAKKTNGSARTRGR